eukprot:CAMPEP_0171121220 /NCGR_PEP_ID=MMETSP0766_2-20121228/101853_1 /TAXON_ID=439317 /ORGANISM="Gambierdiscus australes, Strain CAWD 149" /LENGTH=84 /DNA_ID=CAMNT_0011583989 /DNA_START=36 /DNA_END=286 /DNA_ORIENTATION=+
MVKENISLHISPALEGIDLTGKRYVVTGGTSGAGEATVKFLAEHGAQVLTCGRNTTPAQERIDAAAAGQCQGQQQQRALLAFVT